MAIQPTQQPRRSMLYRVLLDLGAEFEPFQDTAVAMCYPGNISEAESAKAMAIADLSPLPRTGFKGRDTPDWLQQQGVQIPEAPNRARQQGDGSLVLRLSDDEHIFLGDLGLQSDVVFKLNQQWRLEPDRMCYQMPRAETHCWLALTGVNVPEMLAKVCAVDMRLHKFSNHRIAQTSIARTNGVVTRHDLGQTPCFYVLADSASADFMWPCLVDAMAEFKGVPVGLTALQALL